MPKVEIRPGVEMAYEDHWFGKPWTVPETVVMVHGTQSRAPDPMGAAPVGQYRVVRPTCRASARRRSRRVMPERGRASQPISDASSMR
jgi:hypothetical protein